MRVDQKLAGMATKLAANYLLATHASFGGTLRAIRGPDFKLQRRENSWNG
jgi:hypothetical protein